MIVLLLRINLNNSNLQFVRRSPELVEERTSEDGGARTERTSARPPPERGQGVVPVVRGRREREDEAGDPGYREMTEHMMLTFIRFILN
jgi:hypothetical protein